MMRLTLDIAAKTLFNAEVGGDAQAVAGAMEVMQRNFVERFNSIWPVPLWIPTPANLRSRRASRQLDDVIFRIIRQRRQDNVDHGDLLSVLLRARDEDDGTGMSDQQLRDKSMTLFLAGHPTTALVLSWTWYLLAQHPQAEQRLYAEVDALLGDRAATADDWPRLKYTEMIALESMRLYSPAYVIGREATVDCAIGGYHVPRGTTMLMSPWVVQRCPLLRGAERVSARRDGARSRSRRCRSSRISHLAAARACASASNSR